MRVNIWGPQEYGGAGARELARNLIATADELLIIGAVGICKSTILIMAIRIGAVAFLTTLVFASVTSAPCEN